VTAKILLRGGCVLTLGARTPNLRQADLLIEDGLVAEVGPGLRPRDAEVVDATDAIVMPGFVDTHHHAWRSLLRNLGDGGSRADGGSRYAPLPSLIADHYGPEDVYAATLLGLSSAVEAGITTVVDWADVRLDDASLDASLQAHSDAGLRTVFVAAHSGSAGGVRREFLERLVRTAGPSTTVAVGIGDPGAEDADGWGLAREFGRRIHAHAVARGSGLVARLAARRLLGPDVTLVHCTELDERDLDAIAASGASVSLTPSSEMAGDLGPPPIQQLIDRGIRPGLGVDDERVAPGDLFAQMRATISWQHAYVFDLKLAGKAGLPRLMTTRDVIRCATVEGARAAGLGEVTGSLDPGMQADVIVLRTDRPNIFPVNDPIGAVVWGTDTSNLDWVISGGRVLMRDGVLQADTRRVRDLATAALQRVVAAAGLTVGAAPEVWG
jgi:cytosine/adenosine deaminase-related metal-dependent hydrolase